MNLHPMQNLLLIRRDEASEQTPGGLYLAPAAREKPHRGEVLAAGPGRYTDSGTLIPMTVAPGDRVVFAPGVGAAVSVDGEELLLVNEDAVMAVIR